MVGRRGGSLPLIATALPNVCVPQPCWEYGPFLISGLRVPFERVRSECSKSRDLTAIAICDSNRESQITSDLRQCEPFSEKLIVLTCCIGNWHCDSNSDLNRGSNHKSRDLKVRFELPKTAIRGKFLRFGLRDFKSLAICDL